MIKPVSARYETIAPFQVGIGDKLVIGIVIDNGKAAVQVAVEKRGQRVVERKHVAQRGVGQ